MSDSTTATETTTIKKKIPTVAKVLEMIDTSINNKITEATTETTTAKKVPTVDKVQEMIDENNNIPAYYIIDKLTPSATFYYGKIYYNYQEQEQSGYNIQETSILFNPLCEEYEKSLEVQIRAGDKVIYSCNLNPAWSLSLRENYYHSYNNILDLSSIRLTGITKDTELKLWIQQESTFYEITTLPIKKYNEITDYLSISGNIIHNNTNLFDDSNKINTDLLPLKNSWKFKDAVGTTKNFNSFTLNNTTYSNNWTITDSYKISITFYQTDRQKRDIYITAPDYDEGTKLVQINYVLDDTNWTIITVYNYEYVYKNSTTIDLNTLKIPNKYIANQLKLRYYNTSTNIYHLCYINYNSIANDDSILTLGALRDLFYPIGAIYVSTNSTSPANFIGGTWTQITDRFLYCTTSGGATGGSKYISVNNLPSHSHSITFQGYYQVASGSDSDRTSIARSKVSGDPVESGSLTIGSTGSGTAYMPPYYTVYAWKRTA